MVGSRDAALLGNLIGLAAGDVADFQRVRPFLDPLCRRLEHLGDIGAGASMKLALNLPHLVYYQVLSEALRLIDHLSLDPHLLISLFADSTGGPNLLRIRGKLIADAMAGAALPPAQGGVGIFTKDLQVMLSQAAQSGTSLPMANVALAEYRNLQDHHAGDIDGVMLPVLLLQLSRAKQAR